MLSTNNLCGNDSGWLRVFFDKKQGKEKERFTEESLSLLCLPKQRGWIATHKSTKREPRCQFKHKDNAGIKPTGEKKLAKINRTGMKKELCESESSQLVEGTHWGLKGELCAFRNPWTTRGQQDWAQKVPPCPIPPTANTFHSQGSKLGSQTLQAKNAQCPQKATRRALETFPDEKLAQGLGMPWEWELFKTFQ